MFPSVLSLDCYSPGKACADSPKDSTKRKFIAAKGDDKQLMLASYFQFAPSSNLVLWMYTVRWMGFVSGVRTVLCVHLGCRICTVWLVKKIVWVLSACVSLSDYRLPCWLSLANTLNIHTLRHCLRSIFKHACKHCFKKVFFRCCWGFFQYIIHYMMIVQSDHIQLFITCTQICSAYLSNQPESRSDFKQSQKLVEFSRFVFIC